MKTDTMPNLDDATKPGDVPPPRNKRFAPDRDEIRRALILHAGPRHGLELRAFPSKRSHVGTAASIDALVDAAAGFAINKQQVYFCGPVPTNRGHRAAKDTDILRLSRFFDDIDPVRASGHEDDSATDAEKAEAERVAFEIMEYKRQAGWPDPVFTDSGNGFHLHYAIDLPNDAESAALIKALTKALAARFDTDGAKVDKSVTNPSRLSRVPGTRARKGADTPERPWRMSKIISAPSPLGVVTREQLVRMAAYLATPEPAAPRGRTENGAKADPFKPKAATSKAYVKAAIDQEVAAVLHSRSVSAGGEGRNIQLNKSAFNLGQLIGGGELAEAEVWEALERAGLAVGLDEAGVRATIRSGIEAGKLKPRTRTDGERVSDDESPPPRGGAKAAEPNKPNSSERDPWQAPIPLGAGLPVPAFPVSNLPGWQSDFVTHLARATQTPPDLAAMLILAATGAGLANKYEVRVREGWTEPTNLFTAVALESGERKSKVFSEVMEPIRALEKDAIRAKEPAVASAASERRTLEKRMKSMEDRAAKNDDGNERFKLEQEAKNLARRLAAMPVVESPTLICDDATPEILPKLMAANDGRMLQAGPEGTAFEIMSGRYSERPNFDVYLKGHAGDMLKVDRVSRGKDVIEHPALSLALAVQPDVIRGLSKDATMRSRGLLARILYSVPASLVGRRDIAAPPVLDDVAGEYRRVMRTLWLLEGRENQFSELDPYSLNLDSRADGAVRSFEKELEPRLGTDGDLRHLAGWANKLAGAAARIAGGLHVAKAIDLRSKIDSVVEIDTIEAAIDIAQNYLLPHARRAFELMGSDIGTDDAAKVLKWLRRKFSELSELSEPLGPLSVSVIQSNILGSDYSVDQCEAAADVLVKHGYLRPREQPRRNGPGRKPSPTFDINPLIAKEAKS